MWVKVRLRARSGSWSVHGTISGGAAAANFPLVKCILLLTRMVALRTIPAAPLAILDERPLFLGAVDRGATLSAASSGLSSSHEDQDLSFSRLVSPELLLDSLDSLDSLEYGAAALRREARLTLNPAGASPFGMPPSACERRNPVVDGGATACAPGSRVRRAICDESGAAQLDQASHAMYTIPTGA